MSQLPANRRVRWMVVPIVVLLIAALTAHTFAATPNGSARGNGTAPPSAKQSGDTPTSYPLLGDAANFGSATTDFISSGPGGIVWYFLATSSDAGTMGLTAECSNTNPDCIGARGHGTTNGIQGYQGTSCCVSSTTGGVYGYSYNTGGNGVVGEANTGGGAFGVWGRSTTGTGVVGSGGTSGNGVYGLSDTLNGVYGKTYAAAASGVYGENTTSGLYGTAGRTFSSNQNSAGVYGEAPSGVARGVVGSATGGIALGGFSGSGSGFYGSSNTGPGGVLRSTSSTGVTAYTQNNASYAIVTGAGAGTYGNVYVNGRITATGGCCASAQTDQGARQMYATESTQNIFSDQGTANLVDGKAVITIDPMYAQTVNLTEDYMVFLTPRSADTAGLAVVNQTATSFEVRELNKGAGSFKFNWRIDALRQGHEKERMAPAGAPPAALPADLVNAQAPQKLPAMSPPDMDQKLKANK